MPSAILRVEFVELFLRELVVARLVFRLAVGFRCSFGLLSLSLPSSVRRGSSV
jgi:hypothetical protein